MALTAAERQKRRRKKLKEEGTYKAYLQAHAVENKKHREKMKAALEDSSPNERLAHIEHQKSRTKERVRKHREKRRVLTENHATPAPASTSESPSAYNSKHSLTRATNRVKTVLPFSPKKKKNVIRQLAQEFGLNIQTKAKIQSRINKLAQETKEKVKQFYERDDISRMAPGIRDVVTVRDECGKQKLQKRHLCMTIKETHSFFLEQNPTIKIGLSKFADLRPQHVLLSSQTPTNVCTCIYHQNYFLALDALHTHVPDIPLYHKDFPSNCLVYPESESCWFSTCEHDCGFEHAYPFPDDPALERKVIKWKKWQERNCRLVKCEITGTVRELYGYLAEMSPKFFRHSFIKRKQAAKYEEDKVTAMYTNSDVACLQMDFAENYSCVAQDEVQSAHWNQAQITLFTSVMWFKGCVFSRVIVSDLMKHDKNAVVVFLDYILSIMPSGIKTLNIWTDGPASQFKNKYIMHAMKYLADKHSIKMAWNFFATSHGKGPVDGLGGTLKRIATNKVKARRCTINNVKDFTEAVKDTQIELATITKDDVYEKESSLQLASLFSTAPAIKGISNVHFAEFHGSDLVTKCYSTQDIATCPNDAVVAIKEEVVSTSACPSGISVKPGQWYGVVWEQTGYWFIGRVVDIFQDSVKLEFIHQTAPDDNRFKLANDIEVVAKSDVFVTVAPPMPVSSTRCDVLKLSEDDFQLVKKRFRIL